MSEIDWQEELNEKRCKTRGWYGCAAPDGWKDIVVKADEMLAYIDPDYEINQIKEKFGELRYYFGSGKDGVERDIMCAIEAWAVQRSRYTCEECGSTQAELRTQFYWMRTLCDDCAVKRGYDLTLRRDDD